MLKLFVYTLLVIITALILTVYLDLADDPGYLLIAWRNYTFETSLFALVVAIILLGIALRLLYLLVTWINPWRLHRRFRTARQNRSRSSSKDAHPLNPTPESDSGTDF